MTASFRLISVTLLTMLLLGGTPAAALEPVRQAGETTEWVATGPGVTYRTFGGGRTALYHVARVDLRHGGSRVFVPGEADRALPVSEVATRYSAIAAINGDYFDDQLRPIGYTQGPCGEWSVRGPRSKRREFALAIGDDRAAILASPDRSKAPSWTRFVVSGWPRLVENCRAISSRDMPGSDAFTRSPHARTAVGIDRTGRYLYLVTASPTQHVRGVTLPALAEFMQKELRACDALNLDGGGSTVFWAGGLRRQPEAQFTERPVANHLLVVPAEKYPGCDIQSGR